MASNWCISEDLGPEPFPETIVAPIDGAEMVLVPKGSFAAGISREDFIQICLLDQKWNPIFATEIPSRKVYLDTYYIDRYSVTNYQYHKFIEATGHREPMRGGCFLGSATFVRVTCRWTPEDNLDGAHWPGFRCVKEIYPPNHLTQTYEKSGLDSSVSIQKQ